MSVLGDSCRGIRDDRDVEEEKMKKMRAMGMRGDMAAFDDDDDDDESVADFGGSV